VERDLLEWLAGLKPVQDVYDNERGDQGDRAESDDELMRQMPSNFPLPGQKCCSNASHIMEN
jgi:hypothetical protein